MTGTIRSLDVETASGVITAEDGVITAFPLSAVLAYDLPILAVGQLVSFDLDGGSHPKAFNVYVHRASQTVNAKGRRPELTFLRYIGFEHRGNTRFYLFEYLVPGTQKRTLSVNADVALFARHHVGMQEGPALCLHLLEGALDFADPAAWASLQRSLTDHEMLAHVASRPVPRARRGFKRPAPVFGATPGAH